MTETLTSKVIAETIQMPIDLPVDPDAVSLKTGKRKVNDLQESLLFIMDKRKLTLAEIQRNTEIKWGTLMGWHNGDVGSQMVDYNLFALWTYLKVPLEFLCFGVGSEDTEIETDSVEYISKLKAAIKELRSEIETLRAQIKEFESSDKAS